jgi:hypothetical protein
MKLVKPGLNLSPVILLGTVLILAAGCSESVQQGQQQSGSDNNAAAMTAAKAPAAPAKPKQNQGVVKSVEVAGGYTYALVDVGGDEFWLATAVTEVQPGAEVAFDQILFVDRLVNPSAATAQNHQGIVEESMEAAGYSFIRVRENGKSVWLAAPAIPIEVGQSIRWSGGGQMRNFTSRSLDRVFDEITFVNAVHVS